MAFSLEEVVIRLSPKALVGETSSLLSASSCLAGTGFVVSLALSSICSSAVSFLSLLMLLFILFLLLDSLFDSGSDNLGWNCLRSKLLIEKPGRGKVCLAELEDRRLIFVIDS